MTTQTDRLPSEAHGPTRSRALPNIEQPDTGEELKVSRDDTANAATEGVSEIIFDPRHCAL